MRFATERIMNLEPIEPENAVELYLAERETQCADATARSHRSRLGHLVRWCEENDIDNLNDLTDGDTTSSVLGEGLTAPIFDVREARDYDSADGVRSDLKPFRGQCQGYR